MSGLSEQLLNVHGVELCVETFGDPADPPILLIHGAAASMDYWETAFCELLAAGPRYVVRYDHRDTGRSVSYPPGKPGYTGTDLVRDPVGILDALGIGRAHVAGLSMGGGIAQQLVLDFPDRVRSLTLIATSPLGDDLPPAADRIKAAFATEATPTDWSDPDAAVDALIAAEKLYAGTLPYDEPARRALVRAMIARTTDLESAMTNHWILPDDDTPPLRPRLGEIRVPVLVLHGTEDPLFPPAHGEALAREIPDARLVLLGGAGHELPEPTWDTAVPAILAVTSAG
ncbi:alpha/beta hydrolase fold protein [Kribbella flavida DSM 17836]|uniref:Alpha/beta hydrolase fold protein n=1 Tax=Kribbella flavida (strain DSM 17836 / JCM 10339 / NBRC 14399) TaxID=479435 RepID=D2Q3T3_KRIFD|nr:alpha/beta hydrolase [Kribbella flavida]ADB35955.1 alpha/beta hydrolase fold protein [Kribbella flavida DSM 17836]